MGTIDMSSYFEMMNQIQQLIASLEEEEDFEKIIPLLSQIPKGVQQNPLLLPYIQDIRMSCQYMRSSLSPIRQEREIKEAKKRVLDTLTQVQEELKIKEKEAMRDKFEFDENISIQILKKMMHNFHLHLKAMYQDPCHGGGHITQEKVEVIKIGNEYDVQRILYSLIKPIFPDAKTEVVERVGSTVNRYDIDIPECNTTIEVKCTRKSMSERTLNEEMGADGFHYNRQNIIFFVYDKQGIIHHVKDYKESYSKRFDDKVMDIIIIQPVIL